jgi:hypothetical protein
MQKHLVDSSKRLSGRQFQRASETQVGVETLGTIVGFCGVGLVVVLPLAVGITSLGVTPGNNGWDLMGWI